jgi:acetyl-CoA carboxylase carboxyl transferase subunit alpha
MDLAGRFNLPVISFVDTAGAYPGVGGEERGQAEAIARSTERCLTLGTPMICTITGEGGSGGAIALAAGNRVLIMEHSIYSVITPEGGASILFRDRDQAPHMAAGMKIVADDLLRLKVVDRIIPEPPGGAHSDPETAINAAGDAIEEELRALSGLSPDALRLQRAERFAAIGRVQQ